MKVLLDTNILLRLSEKAHPHNLPAIESLKVLKSSGHAFCIGSQTIAEFMAVATRSLQDRGLGMTPSLADNELSKVITTIDVLYDSASTLAELRKLIVAHGVTGKSVHDTRLVAAMNVNGVKDILTFNGQDFLRFNMVNVLNPSMVAKPPSASAQANEP
jgi:predicted nucleic acid-binding protein